ncbi:hypothetical protein AGMMS49975_28270 [Clostridia bacterium]|nr:hypothetical protein AGMMS49975_28270 [Clostridia bacterium]
MITLYVNKKYIPKDLILFTAHDAYFDGSMNYSYIDDRCVKYMHDIDGITRFDLQNQIVDTSFGKGTDIINISTGLKTLLNIYSLRKVSDYIFDISGCGENVLPYLFEIADENAVSLFLRYFRVPKPNLYDFSINGEHLCLKGQNMVSKLLKYSE